MHWLLEAKCFGRNCWELPVTIYAAKNSEFTPASLYHHCHQLTCAHWDILTDRLIANEAEGHD